MKAELNYQQLNEQQLTMLSLLRHPFPDKYFQELKQVAIELLVQQLDDAMNNRDMDFAKARKRRIRRISEK